MKEWASLSVYKETRDEVRKKKKDGMSYDEWIRKALDKMEAEG